MKVWYSMIGQRALEQIITDLNGRGCRKLTIDPSGDVYAIEEGKAPQKELTATVEQNKLVIGW